MSTPSQIDGSNQRIAAAGELRAVAEDCCRRARERFPEVMKRRELEESLWKSKDELEDEFLISLNEVKSAIVEPRAVWCRPAAEALESSQLKLASERLQENIERLHENRKKIMRLIEDFSGRPHNIREDYDSLVSQMKSRLDSEVVCDTLEEAESLMEEVALLNETLR